jgi:drug/metabolite transporter (DMT)-like permease
MTPLRTAVLVASALAAFAGNSILCRAALAGGHADPAAFTFFRVACGAAMLVVITRARGKVALPISSRGTALRALSLVAYAGLFSWAYVRVPAGVGALVLFAFVQLTMILGALRMGAGPRGAQWAGLALALGGLASLTLPGTSAPDPIGLCLMAASGVAWGLYSLLGGRTATPLATTAAAFVAAVPLAAAVAVVALALGRFACDAHGLLLAAVSGAVTSGLGYAIWYAVLPTLGATRAAVVQLAVPVLAALAGVILLAEAPSLRLALASAAVLSGIALATLSRSPAGGR